MLSFTQNAVSVADAYPDINIQGTPPVSQLGYSTNNKYPSFPAVKMNDGRSLISSWQPESAINNKIIQDENIKSNWEYRKYLVKNGADIMASTFREECNDAGCTYANSATSSYSGGPMKFTSLNDASRPIGYNNSDLQESYLTREQLQALKVSPSMTQEAMLGYYGAMLSTSQKVSER
jgi:hypothetical protein